MTEQDFYEVTMLYLSRVSAQNVVHTEIFFDPQVHTMRNVGFEVFMPGLIQGIQVTKNKPPLTQQSSVAPVPNLNAHLTKCDASERSCTQPGYALHAGRQETVWHHSRAIDVLHDRAWSTRS